MRMLALAMLVAAVFGHEAKAADQRYDRRLAAAAAGIVAARMDAPLRGGFGVSEKPVLFVPADRPRAERERIRRPGVWENGLAIAVERKSQVSPEL